MCRALRTGKIYGLIVRQLSGQQSAVNAESGCTAAHKNKTRFIAFCGQQGTLGGQFPHKRIAVLRGQGKAHTVRSNGMAIKTQSILVNSFFMAGSELEVDKGIGRARVQCGKPRGDHSQCQETEGQ